MYHNPFGEADCREEVELLEDYSDIYFNETPFNDAALDRHTYLIVGRRGAGKTALAEYFSFQDRIRDPIYISASDPKTYSQILSKISSHTSNTSRELAIPALKRVWEYIIWQLLWEHVKPLSTAYAHREHGASRQDASGFIKKLVQKLHDVLVEETSSNSIAVRDRIDSFLDESAIQVAKEEAIKLSRKRPIILVIDTLERYDKDDEGNLNAVAALIQFAGEFQADFFRSGIHLKVLVSGEIFPHLEEEVIQNPLKSVKDPVFLFWRPRDLLRLICWRLYKFLAVNNLLKPADVAAIDWNSYRDVHNKVWLPYFGHTVTNSRGQREHSFPYVLRHTQMRPRQLIILCNSIAAHAVVERKFPFFTERSIRLGVKDAEARLANEVISSFSLIYPNIPHIVDAGLQNLPLVFKGNQLDIRARESASEWPAGTYSPGAFKRLVAELGIIGRVKSQTAEVLDAEFEYSLPGRIVLTHRDTCVVHPMYYARLNTSFNVPQHVLTFRGEESDLYESASQ